MNIKDHLVIYIYIFPYDNAKMFMLCCINLELVIYKIVQKTVRGLNTLG